MAAIVEIEDKLGNPVIAEAVVEMRPKFEAMNVKHLKIIIDRQVPDDFSSTPYKVTLSTRDLNADNVSEIIFMADGVMAYVATRLAQEKSPSRGNTQAGSAIGLKRSELN